MLKRKKGPAAEQNAAEVKDFLDMILPGVVKFSNDHYICGDTYRCVWAIREYPPSTAEQAILSRLGDKSNITLRIYNRQVDHMEQNKIIQNAARRNKLMSGGTDLQETITAESNLKDVIQLLANLRKNGECLLHCAVFLELKAPSMQKLKELQSDVLMEMARAKITIDRLNLKQKEGFLSVMPFGSNQFGTQFERVLPSSAVANLYPFNYSGKTDPHGFYLGKDKFGTNILTDFDRRSGDKTNSNILILGNSGQGKSFLLKGIVSNLRESGKSVILMDAEAEYQELTNALGGCYLDFMTGQYVINPLQPMKWEGDADREMDDDKTPETFRKTSALSRHISYLKDFFRAYKDFSDPQLDTIEFMLQKLYRRFDMDDHTDFSSLPAGKYPTMSDFYDLLEDEYNLYDQKKKNLFTEETLREVCLALNSMCQGAESRYFNGHTNIRDEKFLCFGVKGILDANKRLRDAMLFSILSYMTNAMLGEGNCVGAVDELYLFLTNLTAIEYIRNLMKRVRKRNSTVLIASQNIEDFLIPSIREFTKPLFSIPSHQFLFNAGNSDPQDYIRTLQMEEAEFNLIKIPEQGICLYRCGSERYLLKVKFPEFKKTMFGEGGGK